MEPVKYLINPLDFAYVSVCAFVVPCRISVWAKIESIFGSKRFYDK